MYNYIPFEIAAIFFSSEPFSCLQWDSTPGPSAFEANALNVELLDSFVCKLPVPRGR